MRSTKKGFTLVELLVVIAILAILATVSVVGYTAFIEKAHQSVAMQEMTQIRNALVAEDITNELIDLSDGIDGTHQIVVASTEGAQGSPSEAEIVLNFVNDLGIAGTFSVSNKQLQFSPAGKDATATCDFETGEITTAKGAIVVPTCEHTNTAEIPAVPATCTETGLTAGVKCADCGHIITAQEEVAAKGHEGGTATCTEQAICDVCEEPYGYLADHNWEDGKCSVCEAQFAISFENPADRTSLSDDQQIWEKYGIKVTNNKAESTSNVADYAGPARFYKNSEIVIEYANMGKLVFHSSEAKYRTPLVSCIEGATVTENAEEGTVTVEFAEAKDSFTIKLTAGQVRVDSIEVYTFVEPEINPPVEPAHTCESVCPECQGCLDAECTEDACANKCDCEVEDIAPEHTCQNPCDECGKCTNAGCEEAACEDKCQGHVTATPADYSYTFTDSKALTTSAKDNELGEYTWTSTACTAINASAIATKGIQIGTGSNPTPSYSLTTTANGEQIKTIKINASIASSGDAKLKVYVNGVQIGNTITLTTSATEYTFTLEEATTGEITIEFEATKKAYYIKSIVVIGE